MSTYAPDGTTELLLVEKTAIDAVDSLTQATTTDLGASFAKMIISLIVVVVLLFATYWFLRKLIQQKLQKGSPDASIHILERRMLSPKTMLYLVEAEGKRVLIAESQLELRKIETFETPSS